MVTAKEDARTWFLRAKNARDKNDITAGLSAVEKAIKLAPNGVLSLILKGQLLEMNGENEKAEKTYLFATTLSPQSGYAWASLGMLYYETNKYDDGIRCFKIHLLLKRNLAHKDVGILTILAEMELKSFPKAALEHAEKALELEPDWQEAIDIRDAAKQRLA